MSIKFGTDGVRGVYSSNAEAEQGFITPETGFRVGAAAAELLGSYWVMVQDTRPFNDELMGAFCEGVASRGGTVKNLGVLPTPAAAFVASHLTRQTGINHKAVSGSASHNPAADAGIKIFGNDGKKLDNNVTNQIETLANKLKLYNGVTYRVRQTQEGRRTELREHYISAVLSSVIPELRADKFLEGKQIVVDMANGASHWSAPEILGRLGAKVIPINGDLSRPINENSGAEHPNGMIAAVGASEADYGMAFDGDQDRLIAYAKGSLPGKGRILDGDDSVALAMQELVWSESKAKRVGVVTAYSGLGFRRQAKKLGFDLVEVDNGDRYILDAFDASATEQGVGYDGYPIGGEQAGHTLYPLVAARMNHVLSGDGLLTGLQHLQTAALLGKSLLQLSDWDKLGYSKTALTLPRNVNQNEILSRKPIVNAIAKYSKHLGDNGRVHIRPSDTQPLLRVLILAEEQAKADEISTNLSRVIFETANS